MTLVIMAAGMGSRFGGLKQIEPVGPNGEFIIDYSIYDAIKAGFDKVVFIIKEENYDIFKDTIGKRIEGKIKVEYVFQKNDLVPNEYANIKNRVKPLGTGYAVLCCKDIVNEPFAIINADDFYGANGYINAVKFCKENKDENNYGLVSYKLANTLTNSGSVKRGVCKTIGNKLISLVESSIESVDGKIIATALETEEKCEVDQDTVASMNLFVFYPNLFKYLSEDFNIFLKNIKDEEKDEFFLPSVVCNHMNKGDIACTVIDNDSIWKGITYKEELNDLKEYINEEIQKGVYPVSLYN